MWQTVDVYPDAVSHDFVKNCFCLLITICLGSHSSSPKSLREISSERSTSELLCACFVSARAPTVSFSTILRLYFSSSVISEIGLQKLFTNVCLSGSTISPLAIVFLTPKSVSNPLTPSSDSNLSAVSESADLKLVDLT